MSQIGIAQICCNIDILFETANFWQFAIKLLKLLIFVRGKICQFLKMKIFSGLVFGQDGIYAEADDAVRGE